MQNELIHNSIKDKIFMIRGIQVMLDKDLAILYGVSTKRLNEQIKRNIKRFPEDFMFRLNKDELISLKSHFATSNSERGGRRYLPYAFSEQGVASLSGVLKSDKAIEVNIQIMRAFVSMRKFIQKNAELFYRIDNVEKRQIIFEAKTENNFEKVFNALQDNIPKKGIFFEGQIFNAYKFVSDLIRNADKSIILVDNYVDESTLTLLSKRKNNVSCKVYTKKISKQLNLDLEKHNSQHPIIEVKEFNKSHDRFLIIDEKVYHFGASLKDLGKKWFGFSEFDKEAMEIIKKLSEFTKT